MEEMTDFQFSQAIQARLEQAILIVKMSKDLPEALQGLQELQDEVKGKN